jgi:uncharacterized membrane protein YcjF (UPF0283 family)
MGSDPFNAWTIFLTQMIGLSVATERVTETAKQWLGPGLSAHLGQDRYNGAIQTIAIVSGIFVTALSGLNPINIPLYKPFDWGNKADWLAWVVTGVLVSGGSAVWNHLLDMLQAAKVQKEQSASNAVAASSSPTTAQ